MMTAAHMESIESPYGHEDNAPRLRTAPPAPRTESDNGKKKSKKASKPQVPTPQPTILRRAKDLEPTERGEFITKHVTQIIVGFDLIRDVNATEERELARAKLLGAMFSELKMFGDPPPDEVPEDFRGMARNAEAEAYEGSLSKLLIEHEDHPAVMALDTVVDRLGGNRARVDAIQMLRAAAVLVDRAQEQ